MLGHDRGMLVCFPIVDYSLEAPPSSGSFGEHENADKIPSVSGTIDNPRVIYRGRDGFSAHPSLRTVHAVLQSTVFFIKTGTLKPGFFSESSIFAKQAYTMPPFTLLPRADMF